LEKEKEDEKDKKIVFRFDFLFTGFGCFCSTGSRKKTEHPCHLGG
jgi:hypothetical protein